MPDDPAAVQFSVLDPAPAAPIEAGQLADFYAYPRNVAPRWVRGNMIASLDGGATDDGTSGTLGGAGDRAVFAIMRELADVILVGAGTVRAENYSGALLSPAQRQARRHRGQAEVPPIAVVSNRAVFDRDAKVFTRTDIPPMILTSAEAAEDTRRRLGSAAEVIAASGARPDTVDPATALAVLAERGLQRVLCEGGPQLLGSLVGQGLLDELCLTIAPLLVGGAAPRIAAGPSHLHTEMRRGHLIADDAGYLYARYLRIG